MLRRNDMRKCPECKVEMVYQCPKCKMYIDSRKIIKEIIHGKK